MSLVWWCLPDGPVRGDPGGSHGRAGAYLDLPRLHLSTQRIGDQVINVNDMIRAAADISKALSENGFPSRTFEGYNRQALGLAEEVGEFVGAYRRWSGQARRTDTFEHVSEELADMIITAFVTAEELGIDIADELDKKLKVIFSRGWRDGVERTR